MVVRLCCCRTIERDASRARLRLVHYPLTSLNGEASPQLYRHSFAILGFRAFRSPAPGSVSERQGTLFSPLASAGMSAAVALEFGRVPVAGLVLYSSGAAGGFLCSIGSLMAGDLSRLSMTTAARTNLPQPHCLALASLIHWSGGNGLRRIMRISAA